MFSEITCTSWYVDLSAIFLMALSLVPNEHSDHTFCFYVRWGFSETWTFTKTLRMYTSHTNHMTTTKVSWQSHVLPHVTWGHMTVTCFTTWQSHEVTWVTWGHMTVTWGHMTVTWGHMTVTWQSHEVTWQSHEATWQSHDSPFHHTLLRCHHFPWNSLGVENTKDEKSPTIYDMAVTLLLFLN